MNSKLKKYDLINFFEEGCKNKQDWKIGTEHEKFGFFKKNYKPIDYSSIKQIFSGLYNKFGWEKIYENELIIGMYKNGSSISLEPGGQIELSGAPLKNLFETCNEVKNHQFELNYISKSLDIDYMGIGFNPKWNLKNFPIMPKKRYQIMKNYMNKVGTKGHDMMFRTSTIQANLDFDSEKDMIKKFRVAIAIQPAIIALYANSPFVEGKLSKYLSHRSWVWTKTDNQRCGILPFVFDEGFSFEMYVDYLLDVPMYFVKRDDEYIDCSGCSFRDFLNGKLKNLKDKYPTIQDWVDHTSTVFPEVRLKKFLELRGADGGPWSSVCALPAFWTGIFYDKGVLDETWELVKYWSENQRKQFYNDVTSFALQSATPDKVDIKTFLKVLLNLSKKGLTNRRILNEKENDESVFLNPLFEILENGLSPAELWRKLFLEKWEENVDNIFLQNSFGVGNK